MPYTPVVDRYPTHFSDILLILFFRPFKTGSLPSLSGGMQLRICVTPSNIESRGIKLFSLLKIKLLGSLFTDRELVNAMQPSFLIDFAK